jgi:hypothetical protein
MISISCKYLPTYDAGSIFWYGTEDSEELRMAAGLVGADSTSVLAGAAVRRRMAPDVRRDGGVPRCTLSETGTVSLGIGDGSGASPRRQRLQQGETNSTWRSSGCSEAA